jgi:hypothetical protein
MRQSLIALLCFLCAATATNAQQIGGKNVFKVNLTGAILKNIDVQYERVTNPRQSFALGLGISPNVSLPFKSTLMEQFGDNEDASRAIESTKFTKITITPEYRFYFGKKGAPAGFYLAPFARYTNMSFDQVYNFTPSSGKEHNAKIKGKFNGIGGGLMIGSQWLLGKNMTLDWWIMGPFIGTMNADITGTDDMSDMSAQDKADLESDIEGVDIPFWKVDATVGNNTIDAKLTGPFVGVRAFGLCLGIRF